MKDKILSYLNGAIVVPILLVMIMIIPLPALLVEILIVLNFILALTLFVFVLYTKKISSFYPTLVLLFTLFGQTVNISAIRLILTKGAELDGVIIKYISSFILGSEKEILIKGLAILIISIVINILITRSCTLISEVAARFTLDSLEIKLMAIDIEYNSGAITEEEALTKKQEAQKESDFFGSLDGAGKFVSGNENVRIIILMISFICAIVIGTLIKGETISNTINTYFPLIISSGILCMMPAFLVTLGMKIIITRYGGRLRLNEKEINKNPDAEIRLELSYGLLSIVSDELENNLQTCIQELRKDIESECVYFPSIHVIDNDELNDYEYSIIFYGKNMGTYKIETEDDKNLFDSKAITNIISNLRTRILFLYGGNKRPRSINKMME